MGAAGGSERSCCLCSLSSQQTGLCAKDCQGAESGSHFAFNLQIPDLPSCVNPHICTDGVDPAIIVTCLTYNVFDICLPPLL